MKLVTAIVRPHAVDDIKTGLQEIGIEGLTLSEVRGYGRQRGHTEVYRGAEYTVEFVPEDAARGPVHRPIALDDVVETIVKHGRSGQVGDGKVFVTSGRARRAHPHRRGGPGRAVTQDRVRRDVVARLRESARRAPAGRARRRSRVVRGVDRGGRPGDPRSRRAPAIDGVIAVVADRRLRPRGAVSRVRTSTCCCCTTAGRGDLCRPPSRRSSTRCGTLGLKVGYAVRSRKEAVAAVDDLDTATAMLDARLVGGDAPLLRRVERRRSSAAATTSRAVPRRADRQGRRAAGPAGAAAEVARTGSQERRRAACATSSPCAGPAACCSARSGLDPLVVRRLPRGAGPLPTRPGLRPVAHRTGGHPPGGRAGQRRAAVRPAGQPWPAAAASRTATTTATPPRTACCRRTSSLPGRSTTCTSGHGG